MPTLLPNITEGFCPGINLQNFQTHSPSPFSLFIILISKRHIQILKRTGEEYAILLKPKPCQEPCQVKHNKCLYLK